MKTKGLPQLFRGKHEYLSRANVNLALLNMRCLGGHIYLDYIITKYFRCLLKIGLTNISMLNNISNHYYLVLKYRHPVTTIGQKCVKKCNSHRIFRKE